MTPITKQHNTKPLQYAESQETKTKHISGHRRHQRKEYCKKYDSFAHRHVQQSIDTRLNVALALYMYFISFGLRLSLKLLTNQPSQTCVLAVTFYVQLETHYFHQKPSVNCLMEDFQFRSVYKFILFCLHVIYVNTFKTRITYYRTQLQHR